TSTTSTSSASAHQRARRPSANDIASTPTAAPTQAPREKDTANPASSTSAQAQAASASQTSLVPDGITARDASFDTCCALLRMRNSESWRSWRLGGIE